MKIEIKYFSHNELNNKTVEIIEEAPLFVNINDKIDKTMLRTPGDDKKLLTGMAFTEGFIKNVKDISNIKVEQNRAYLQIKNLKNIKLNSVDAVLEYIKGFNKKEEKISLETIRTSIATMESKQILRRQTGASHAVMSFSYNLKPISIFEDVGRHNAFDKVIGEALINEYINDIFFVTLSSRISFEMAKKAAIAGIKVIIAISRPTSMAIELALKANLTLINLTKNNEIIVYPNPKIEVVKTS